MKLGDLIHYTWQHGRGSNIHRGIAYELQDGETIGLNDLRAIWEYLNTEIPNVSIDVDGYKPISEDR